MNRIIPYIILLATILAFVFAAKTLGIFLIIAFILSAANLYSDVRNRTNVFRGYSFQYMLAKLFFWNRIVNGRVSFYFDFKELETDGEMTLGGIRFKKNYIALRYEYDEDQEPYFSLCTISDIDDVEYIGKPYHLTKDIRYVSLHFSHQFVQTIMGPRWFIMYWVITDAGEKILYGKVQSKKNKWTLMLPDKINSGLKMEIHA